VRTGRSVTAFTSALCGSLRFSAATAGLVLALGTIAHAQSSPATVPTPAPSPAPKLKLDTSSLRRPVDHLPIIDIVPIYTQPGFFTTSSQTKGYDPLDVGGTIQIPITRSLSFSFDRLVDSILNQASERVLIDGVPTFPGLFRDSVLVERLDYQLGALTIESGSSFRHRMSGGPGVSGAPFPFTVSSSEAHYDYLGLTYTTRPIRALLNSRFVFGLTGEAQQVDHHVGIKSGNTVAFIDENAKQNIYYESTEQVGLLVPLDRGVTFSAKEAWGAINYYENSPFPWRLSSSITLGLTKKFNNFFSLTMRTQNSDYIAQGFPFPAPNALHTEAIDVLADFHLDMNKLVRERSR
jgi:hypothetical protein